jgi:hypothetical protein
VVRLPQDLQLLFQRNLFVLCLHRGEMSSLAAQHKSK